MSVTLSAPDVAAIGDAATGIGMVGGVVISVYLLLKMWPMLREAVAVGGAGFGGGSVDSGFDADDHLDPGALQSVVERDWDEALWVEEARSSDPTDRDDPF